MTRRMTEVAGYLFGGVALVLLALAPLAASPAALYADPVSDCQVACQAQGDCGPVCIDNPNSLQCQACIAPCMAQCVEGSGVYYCVASCPCGTVMPCESDTCSTSPSCLKYCACRTAAVNKCLCGQ
jgi:hypothetical protein